MLIAENLEVQNKTLLLRLDVLERELKLLREENAMLKKYRFGRSSERLEPGQMNFFETGEWPVPGPVPAVEETVQRKPRKPAMGHGRGVFPNHLERDEHRLKLPEDERACPHCKTTMQLIGEDIT